MCSSFARNITWLPRRQRYLKVFVSILSPHKDTRTRWRHQILSFIVSTALSFLACSVRCNSSKFSYYSAEFQKMHDFFEVLWKSKIFQMRKPAEGNSSVYRDARSKHTGNTSTLWGGGIPNDHKWVEAEWRHVLHIYGPTRTRHRSWIFYTLWKKWRAHAISAWLFKFHHSASVHSHDNQNSGIILN